MTASSSQAFPISERELVCMLAMQQALQALAIDSMLPALSEISQDMGVTDPNHRQWVIGVYLIFMGLGSLFPGALSDRFGRRPIVLGSLAIYILTAIGCALTSSFTVLLVMRALQAVGTSALGVLPAAIVRDRFEGDRMARLQSMISVIFMAVPMLAPALGQGVLELAGWRWIFYAMAALAFVVTVWVWKRLPETLAPENRQTIEPAIVAKNMLLVVRTRSSIGYVLASALLISGTWGYINSSEQLVAEHFGAGKMFPIIFAVIAGSIALGNFFNARIVERYGARRVSQTALIIYLFLASLQVYFASDPHQTLWSFVPTLAANLAALGLISANFGSIALQPFSHNAGAASSVQSFLRIAIAGITGSVIGQAFDGTALPMTLGMLVAAFLSLLLVLWSENGRLFRRLYPAGTPRPQG